ncbi:FtsX-like permease family protein [Modestobacter muralis]|uniref:FtsX-like permease family protein n=1 Tax=Modestobacter muralis TaxID=1608614 RepID=A0A6P0EZ32_9ACTN|nr:FtsX-like permease family protein [Modestobacter muralis]NEK96325.1 FtsX-like permease family protein [Modestobacter muralis]NEN53225.1 FtsX-like permease family protein [Modestobacter muralis]
MRAVTLASIRAHLPRLVASTLAIVIAVGFVVATLVLNETMKNTVLEAAGARYVGADAVVTAEDGSDLTDQVARLSAVPGVRSVDPGYETSVSAVVPGRTGTQYLAVESVATDPQLRWQHLTAGALPTGPGEVAVSERAGAALGDVLTLTSYDATDQTTTTEATVVGIVDLRGDPSADLYGRLYATGDQAVAWGATQPVELRISGADGADPATVAGAVTTALAGTTLVVRTGAEQAGESVASLTGDADFLTTGLLLFAGIAVLVAGLVIANTFAVLLAQRTRDLALLRCVGATAQQVRRSVLGEALLTGLAASVIGVLAGIGLAAAVSAVVGTDSPIPLSGVSVPPYVVLVGLVVGTLTTLLAALAPARAATRVAPLAALRPTDPVALRSRGGVVRLVIGLLLALPGIGLMAIGVVTQEVFIAFAGVVLSSLGGLLLAQRAVPPVVAGAGRLLGRVGGLPARLAAGNATRNPRRTAATATALLIGVTLTTAMVVGASSTRATAQAGLVAAYPTDVIVEGNGETLPAAVLDQLTAVDGVVAGTALTSGQLVGPDQTEVTVKGVDVAQALPVLRSTTQLKLPEPGTVVLPGWAEETWGVSAGHEVTFTGAGGPRTFTVVSGDTSDPLLPAADLAALAPDAAPGTLWLRLGDDVEQNDVVDEVTDIAGTAAPSSWVSGMATERAAIDQVVDVLLLIVTGLLGVAVLIALIGVGNTLALSVVERRQESGLLRALGLTRRQLRGLLAWEAVLVAGVAAVLGVLVGGVYGLVGVASALGEVGELTVSVPWLQVAAIVVVATVAGLLASVLPARRAAMTPPVAAIAG